MCKAGGGYSNDCAVKAECRLTDTRQKVVLRGTYISGGTCRSVCGNVVLFAEKFNI
jgi:hypothetical protein